MLSPTVGHIHIKAFSERFGFDALRTSQLLTDSQKTKQRGRPLGCFIQTFVIRIATLVWSVGMQGWYIYIGVGLSALLGFDNQGNARAFTSWTGHRTGSTFLCVCKKDIIDEA